MAKKKSLFQEFTKGILIENPVLRLVLGTCPTLAVSTSVESALGMGVAASIVLVCSNIAIAALKKVIPQKVRIPAYIVIIASFVTIVQMLVKAFVPQIDAQLGVYLPLIVVNCIILGRAEAFACKNSVAASAVDGLGMGVGFTAALLLMGAVRELLGTGAIAGLQIIPASVSPMLIFILPPGGFFVFGILMACANKLADKKGLSKAELKGCEACPMAASCSLRGEVENKDKKDKKEADENNAFDSAHRYPYRKLYSRKVPRHLPVPRRVEEAQYRSRNERGGYIRYAARHRGHLSYQRKAARTQ